MYYFPVYYSRSSHNVLATVYLTLLSPPWPTWLTVCRTSLLLPTRVPAKWLHWLKWNYSTFIWVLLSPVPLCKNFRNNKKIHGSANRKTEVTSGQFSTRTISLLFCQPVLFLSFRETEEPQKISTCLVHHNPLIRHCDSPLATSSISFPN